MTHSRGAVLATIVVLAALVGAVAPAPAAAAQEDCSFPVTQTDATGTELTLEEEPETVVVAGASSAQTVWELGEEDRVVGMPAGENQGTDYLEGAGERTHVLEGQSIDREQVVELEPDLVIVPSLFDEASVEALRDLGLTVYYEGELSSFEDIRENVQTTGRLLGACEAADETTDWMDERLGAVEDSVEGQDRPSVYYWVSQGYTAPESSFQNDLLERAGARNAAANMTMDGWQLSDEEQIVEEDPEYLLLQNGSEVPDNEAIQSTTAVEEDNVIYVDRNHWNQNAPRVVLAVEEIAEQLHPAAFEVEGEVSTDGADDSDADGGDDAGAGDGADADGADADESTADSDAPSDEDDGLPGFGVAPAVAALLAIAGALGRRA